MVASIGTLFMAWCAIFACDIFPAVACTSTPCCAANGFHHYLLPLDAEYEDGIGARYPREVAEAGHADETNQEGLGAAEGEEEPGGVVPPAVHGGRPGIWYRRGQSQGRGTSACGPDGLVLFVGRHVRASPHGASERGDGHEGHRDLDLLGASVRHADDTHYTAWWPKGCPETADHTHDRACRIDEGEGHHVAAWISVRPSTGGSGEAASSPDQCSAAQTEEGGRAASGTSWRRTRGAKDEEAQDDEGSDLTVHPYFHIRDVYTRRYHYGAGEGRGDDAQMGREECERRAERSGNRGREEGLGPSDPINPVVTIASPCSPHAAGENPSWCSWAAHASPSAHHALKDKHAAICNVVALVSHVGRPTTMQREGGVNKTNCVCVMRRRETAGEGAAAGKRRAAAEPAVQSPWCSYKCLGPGEAVRPGLGVCVNACGERGLGMARRRMVAAATPGP